MMATKKKHKITNILLTRRNEDTFRHGRFFLSLPETNAPVFDADGWKKVRAQIILNPPSHTHTHAHIAVMEGVYQEHKGNSKQP